MPQDRHDDPFEWIDEASERRSRAGLVRTLTPRPADSPLLDLAGNDYLGLARHPEVTAAAGEAAARWGAGSTGSRLVTGHTELHAALEAELAAFCGFEAALLFSSGYAANLAVVTALSGRDALILSDAGNHASLIDGCRLSRAEVAVVPHADPEAVRKALDAASPAGETAGETAAEAAAQTPRGGGRPRRRALVVTDSVFSVDGDAAPLPALAAACRAYGAALVVDDAHGFGVLGDGGRGAPQGAGLAGAPDVVVTVTLSKALGSQGGAVLGPARVIEHLVNSARTFIFDTGLNPAAVGAALASLRLLRREPERAIRARALATGLYERLTAAGLSAVRPDASVVSVRAPSPERAVRWAVDCRASGLAVGCFRPPSVTDGISRVRLTVRADLTDQQIEEAADTVVRTAPTA
ncbi:MULTISPECIES: 8-amino-7-oxononanoate synthase [unclassified Streptomyces]|uniref:8-amino-7-oxononanoate synthase n=1 Tax=unclassified Streptomyces TaxID=2593676 RepID=UPI00336A1F4D